MPEDWEKLKVKIKKNICKEHKDQAARSGMSKLLNLAEAGNENSHWGLETRV